MVDRRAFESALREYREAAELTGRLEVLVSQRRPRSRRWMRLASELTDTVGRRQDLESVLRAVVSGE